MDIKEICVPISSEIERLDKVMSQHLSSSVPFVEKVVEYTISNGGKRLRPILTILGAKMAGYQGDASISIGASIEFMHTASLLHDDVIDSAPLRRGRTSVNKKWGNLVSVLVGDFFYCRAMDILVKQGNMKILRVVTDAVTKTTEGEIFEITKSNDINVTKDDYLKIIGGKTAELIGSACEAGAILGGVNEEFQESIKRFGICIGMAFQLVDDVLDYNSDEKFFGKKNGTDLREGKLTLPLIRALEKCDDKERQLIKDCLISDQLDEKSFGTIYQTIEKYDGLKETMALAESYIDQAKSKIAPFRHSLEKEALLSLADYVIHRES